MRKASTEGIAIQGQQGSRLLPEQLLKEAFILSDLFDIGELAALELLLAGKVDIRKMHDFNQIYKCFTFGCILCYRYIYIVLTLSYNGYFVVDLSGSNP